MTATSCVRIDVFRVDLAQKLAFAPAWASPWLGLAVPLALAAAPAGVLLLLGPARFVVLALGFFVVAPA